MNCSWLWALGSGLWALGSRLWLWRSREGCSPLRPPAARSHGLRPSNRRPCCGKVGLPRNESQELVERVLSEISETLSQGEGVKLSSFGSFGVRSKAQRMGRNPKTGEEVPITPRRVLVFRPSNIMKERINTRLNRRKAAE